MNAPDDDPYFCLGISPGASLSEIRKAYKSAVQKLHPDRNPSAHAHAEFLKVQWAYKTLLENPDHPGFTPKKETEHRPQQAASYSPRSDELPKEGDATIVVHIPLEEAGMAHERIVSAKLAYPCSACSGIPPGCGSCGGTGQVMVARKWKVTIPARTLDGTWMIGSQLGHRGARFGRAGDVRVQVKWAETGSWKWDGRRLVATVSMGRGKMKAGGTHAIRMPDGKWVWWTVPPNTIEGQEFQWGDIAWGGMTTQAAIVVKKGWSLFSPRGRLPLQNG